jgi:hypothetical protein
VARDRSRALPTRSTGAGRATPEVLGTVPVRSCARGGRAVDLVLDRGQRNRSQFGFTERHTGAAAGGR